MRELVEHSYTERPHQSKDNQLLLLSESRQRMESEEWSLSHFWQTWQERIFVHTHNSEADSFVLRWLIRAPQVIRLFGNDVPHTASWIIDIANVARYHMHPRGDRLRWCDHAHDGAECASDPTTGRSVRLLLRSIESSTLNAVRPCNSA